MVSTRVLCISFEFHDRYKKHSIWFQNPYSAPHFLSLLHLERIVEHETDDLRGHCNLWVYIDKLHVETRGRFNDLQGEEKFLEGDRQASCQIINCISD